VGGRAGKQKGDILKSCPVKYQIQTSRAKETAKSNADTLKPEMLKAAR